MNHEIHFVVCQRECKEELRWILVLLVYTQRRICLKYKVMESWGSAPD